MTKLRRVADFLIGAVMLAAGFIVMIAPNKVALMMIIILIGVGMTLRGLQVLFYYLSLARNMVGGKYTLYWGMIYLDLGILAGSISGHPAVYAIVYIAALSLFDGAVSVLRAKESRKAGGHWRVRLAYGITMVLLAASIIVSGVVYHAPETAVFVYGAGLIYTAVLRIASAFRQTSIVYIQ